MAKRCKVGDRIVRNYFFLKKLSKSSNMKRLEILNGANSDQLLSLVEICVNVLRQNFKLSPKQRSKLVPHANFIRKLSRCRTEKSAKKIIQKGGGIGSIASLLAPVLFEVTRFLLK